MSHQRPPKSGYFFVGEVLTPSMGAWLRDQADRELPHTLWLDDATVLEADVSGLTVERVPSAINNADYLSAMYAWYDAAFTPTSLTLGSVNLAEVVKFDVVLPLRETVYLPWILGTLDFRPTDDITLVLASEKHSAVTLAWVELWEKATAWKVMRFGDHGTRLNPKSSKKEQAYRWYQLIKSLTQGWRSKSTPPNADILVLEYFANSAKLSVAFGEYFRSQGQSVGFIKARPMAVKSAFHGQVYELFRLVRLPLFRSLSTFRRLRRQAKAMVNGALRSSFGDRLPPIVLRHLSDRMCAQLDHAIMDAVPMVLAYNQLFAQYRPKALITTSAAATFIRALTGNPVRDGMELVYLQHGLSKGDVQPDLFQHDTFFVWGPYFKQVLLSTRQMQETQIYLVSPAFAPAEVVKTQAPVSRQVAYFAARSGGMYVSVARHLLLLEKIRTLAQQCTEYTFVVKLHPSDRHGAHIHALGSGLENLRFEEQLSSQELIAQSEWCMVTTSTVGLEVCQVGKPLIYFDTMLPHEQLVPYRTYGAAVCVEPPYPVEEVRKALQEEALAERLVAGQREMSLTFVLPNQDQEATFRSMMEVILRKTTSDSRLPHRP